MGVTLFDDASLVLIPSGIKASKVYSVKPEDGTGDLDFSRASTATRVNSAGLIESGRTNFIRNSSMVGAATPNTIPTNWTAGTLTGMTREVVGVGTESGFPYVDIRYFGTPSATSFFGITFETNTQIAALSGQAWAYSFYFKKIAGTVPFAALQLTEYNSSGVFLTNTGVVAPFNTTTTLTRFTGTRTLTQATTAFTNIFIRIDVTAATAYDFTMRFYAPQIEPGSVATDWIPTTTAAVTIGPTNNVPRLDYSGGATCPRLLLEPQRTNVALDSETFGAGTGTTIVLNNTASPDGYVSADKLVEDTSTGVHITSVGGALGGTVDSSVYSVSVFAKAAGRTRINMFDNGQSGAGAAPSNFDIENGVVISGTGKIENYGNGWYRCIIFPAKTAGTNANVQIRLIDTGINFSYTGNGTSGVFLWGKQVEAGAFVSSYIPTTTASVTRLAETCNKTGISSLIGQTEGTMFLDFIFKTPAVNTSGQIAISDPTNPYDRVLIWNNLTFNTLAANLQVNGSNIFNTSLGTFVDGQRYKIALAYKSGSTAAYVNGTQVFTNSSTFAFSSTMTDFILGAYQVTAMEAHQLTNQAALFPTRLTNSQLLELTSL